MSTAPAPSLDYKTQPNNHTLENIPGSDGYPVVGNALGFVSNVIKATRKQVEKHGEVSRYRMGDDMVLLVVGADNYQEIFLDKEKNFSTEMGYNNQLGIFYEGALLLRDFDEHRFHRRIMLSAFKFDTMRTYMPTINEIIRKHLTSWPEGKRFTFYPKIKEALLEVGSNIFLGIEDYNEEAAAMNTAFDEVAQGTSAILRWKIPGGRFLRGFKGKKVLQDFILNQIALRRQGNSTDMLSHMCRERTEEGNFFSDMEIVQHTAFLLFAAHDTSTSALSHMMMYLGKHPEWQERLREESLRIGSSDLDFDNRDSLPGLELCFQEILRLHPPVPAMTRRTIRETNLGGVTIPPNTMLFMPPVYNQRDKKYWTNPDTFDPDRFGPERMEHKNHNFCFHPFGGGAHKCIGMHFAQLLVKTFMHQFVMHSSLVTHQKRDPKLQWVPLTKPKDNVPMTLTKIT